MAADDSCWERHPRGSFRNALKCFQGSQFPGVSHRAQLPCYWNSKHIQSLHILPKHWEGGFKKVKLRENWSKTALIFCIKSVLFFLKVNHCCSCLSHNCPRCKMQLIYIVFTEIMKESFWGFSIHTILLLDEKSALIRTGLCQLCKNIKWNNKIGGEIL